MVVLRIRFHYNHDLYQILLTFRYLRKAEWVCEDANDIWRVGGHAYVFFRPSADLCSGRAHLREDMLPHSPSPTSSTTKCCKRPAKDGGPDSQSWTSTRAAIVGRRLQKLRDTSAVLLSSSQGARVHAIQHHSFIILLTTIAWHMVGIGTFHQRRSIFLKFGHEFVASVPSLPTLSSTRSVT